MDFFTREDIKDMYKGFVKTIATRVNSINGRTYKDDPTIMAWVSGESGHSGHRQRSWGTSGTRAWAPQHTSSP